VTPSPPIPGRSLTERPAPDKLPFPLQSGASEEGRGLRGGVEVARGRRPAEGREPRLHALVDDPGLLVERGLPGHRGVRGLGHVPEGERVVVLEEVEQPAQRLGRLALLRARQPPGRRRGVEHHLGLVQERDGEDLLRHAARRVIGGEPCEQRHRGGVEVEGEALVHGSPEGRRDELAGVLDAPSPEQRIAELGHQDRPADEQRLAGVQVVDGVRQEGQDGARERLVGAEELAPGAREDRHLARAAEDEAEAVAAVQRLGRVVGRGVQLEGQPLEVERLAGGLRHAGGLQDPAHQVVEVGHRGSVAARPPARRVGGPPWPRPPRGPPQGRAAPSRRSPRTPMPSAPWTTSPTRTSRSRA
jgi:hypothetical protein